MANSKKMGMDKRFLASSPEETGYICWSVELSTKQEASPLYQRVECELQLADCYKKVHIDFNCYSTKDLDKRIQKLDTLLASLGKLRESLVEAKSTATRMGLK